MESRIKLYCTTTADGLEIYGLRRFASFTIRARQRGDSDLAHDADFVYGFKKHGSNAARVESEVRAVADYFGCDAIVAAPGHSMQFSRLQTLFGATLRRIVEVQTRKYDHSATIAPQTADTLQFAPITARKILIVDDVCTTGATLRFLRDYIRQRGAECVLLAVGINHKMNPAAVDEIVCNYQDDPQPEQKATPADPKVLNNIRALAAQGVGRPGTEAIIGRKLTPDELMAFYKAAAIRKLRANKEAAEKAARIAAEKQAEEAAAQEAATTSGKKAYITKKTLQAARDSRKISDAEFNFIESAGRGRRNSTRYRHIIEKVRTWLAAKTAKRAAASSADRVAALVAKRNEIGEIPPPRHPRIVERCRDDPALFGWLYCRQLLDHRPSPIIRECLIYKIRDVIVYGGQLAVEIYRGGGKTTWMEICIVWGILYGYCDFPLDIAASHPLAKAVRKAIFDLLATSDAILADFPAVPTALRKMNGAVQKGLSLTYNGENVGFVSSDAFLRLPMMKGGDGEPLEPACGAVLACRGVGASVRGLNINGKRPGVILIDDPMTQKDAASSATVQRIDDYIHADVLNLAANTDTVSAFIAITPQRVGDLAQRIADRTIHPNWSVTVCPFLISLPKNFDDLAGEFCDAFYIDAANDDFKRSNSRAWYVANRERFADCVPADPLAFDKNTEVDAVHHALLKYASSGRDAFYAELQLTVKREEHAFVLMPDTVLSRVRKGVDMRTIPDGTVLTVAATDINPSYALSTLVCAFDVKLTGFIPLYRVEPIRISNVSNDTEFSARLFDELSRHARDIAAQGIKIDRWGIDAGGRQFDAVTRFAPLARGIVCAGEATAMLGRAGRNWNPYVRSRIRSAMNGTVRCRDMQGRTWLAFNADEKKEQVQRAFSSEPGAPGGLSLFDSGARHVDFAIQMTNERIRTKTKIASNDGLDRWAIVWESKDPHDLLDCGAMCYALAADENLTGAGAPIRTVKQWTF